MSLTHHFYEYNAYFCIFWGKPFKSYDFSNAGHTKREIVE